MKPVPFRYLAARSLEEAAATLAAEGDGAKLLAGGQSLVPMLNFRLVRPALLLDLNRVPGLDGIAETGDGVSLGALARQRTLETSPLIARHFPVVAAAMPLIAHLAIRNRGTLGGSLAHADPAAELPMLALLLDARIHTHAPAGTRTHDAASFFLSALTTLLRADEIITRVDLPFLPPRTGWAFEELARRHGDFALAAVAVTLSAEHGRARRVRIALMGVADTPLRAHAAEAALEGAAFGDAAVAAAVAALRANIAPHTDLHATAEYRRHLAGVLAARALRSAWQRAGAG